MAKPTQKKPNILVIWGDDIGITNLSCYSDGIDGLPDAQHRSHREGGDEVHGLPTASRAARRAAPRSSPGRASSAPASPRSACLPHRSASRPRTRPLPSC